MTNYELETLDETLFIVKKQPTKQMVFCLFKSQEEKINKNKINFQECNFKIESFVRMSILSEDLQKKIREEIYNLEKTKFLAGV